MNVFKKPFLNMVFVGIQALALHTQASELNSFEQVWSQIRQNHPELQSAKKEWESAQASESRYSRHWLPSLSFSAKGFSTNDPTLNFIGNLSQRSVTQGDFVPSTLNQPGVHSFAQFTLGAQLPIYSGGLSRSQALMGEIGSLIRERVLSAKEIEIYSSLAVSYGGILNADDSLLDLKRLNQRAQEVLKGYGLGSKSNPMGYSGLLGLKSTINRLRAFENELELSRTVMLTQIQKRLGGASTSLKPSEENFSGFVQKAFPQEGDGTSSVSNPVAIAQMTSDLDSLKVDVERSRFLPHLGLFAEGNEWMGAQSSAFGYAGGLYLRWSLFDPSDFGKVRESKLLAESSELKEQEVRNSDEIARSQLKATLSVLNENASILIQSTELLNEQVVVSARLFQNGGMNVLQLVEVFNRRADLIDQLYRIRQKQLETHRQWMNQTRQKGI